MQFNECNSRSMNKIIIDQIKQFEGVECISENRYSTRVYCTSPNGAEKGEVITDGR